MKRMKRNWTRFLAGMLVGVLTVTNIGVVPTAAEEEITEGPIILRQSDFEGLDSNSSTLADDIVVTIGGRDNTVATFSLGTEENNKYASFKASGSNTKLFEINHSGAGTTKTEGKTLWITMDLRASENNEGALLLRSRAGSLKDKEFLVLSKNTIDGTNYTIEKWTTIVFEINENDNWYRTYVVSDNGELVKIKETTNWEGTVTEFIKIQVLCASNNEGAWDIDNVAIYQNDTYVDLFASSDNDEESSDPSEESSNSSEESSDASEESSDASEESSDASEESSGPSEESSDASEESSDPSEESSDPSEESSDSSEESSDSSEESSEPSGATPKVTDVIYTFDMEDGKVAGNVMISDQADSVTFGTATDGDETSGTNSYMTLTRTGTGSSRTADALLRFYINTLGTHSDADGNHTCDTEDPLWLTLDVAKGEKALKDVVIKVVDRAKTKIPMFTIDDVVKDSDSVEVATLSEAQWVKLAIKFDNTGKLTSYIVNEDGSLTECAEVDSGLDVKRFYYLEVSDAMTASEEELGGVLKIDNVAAYHASGYVDMFDKIEVTDVIYTFDIEDEKVAGNIMIADQADSVTFGTATDGDETSGTNAYMTLTRTGTGSSRTDYSLLRFYINTSGTHADADGNHTCNTTDPLWLTLDVARGEKSLKDVAIKVVDRAKTKIPMFTIDDVVKDSDSDEVATLSEAQWVKLAIKFDNTGKLTSYIVNEDGSLTKCAEVDSGLDVKRFYYLEVSDAMTASEEELGGVLKIDNVAAYHASDYVNVFDYIAEDDSKIDDTPKVGVDVEMVHPDLDDFTSGIAVMAGQATAYVYGQSVTIAPLPVLAESGNDVMVPGTFIKTYLGVDVADETAMYALGEAALNAGKTATWDSRGMVVVTGADSTVEQKLITLLAGYLETGKEVNNYAVDPVFTQSIIDEAVALENESWSPVNGNVHPAEKCAVALYYLTLATHFDSQAAATDGTLCKDAALDKLRYLIAGGHEPFASVGCFWGHAVVASALTLIKNTPVIYDELTVDEKDRMDWLMRGLAIAGNWGFNDLNSYLTGFDMAGNFNKGFNPNFRNTYATVVVNASLYFGAEKLDEIFKGFEYETYIAKYEDLGFTNILTAWTAEDGNGTPVGQLMEDGGECYLRQDLGTAEAGQYAGDGVGVKVPFSYMEHGLDDLVGIFVELLDYTYAWEVQNTYNFYNGFPDCYILSGKESPYTGQMGMLREFAADAGRSRISYTYDSYMIINTVLANLKLLGVWDSSTKEMREFDNRIYVGHEDLIFKMIEGYRAFSNGKARDEFEYSMEYRGNLFVKDMWRNFHCMLNEEVSTLTKKDYEQGSDTEQEPGTNPEPPIQGMAELIYKLDMEDGEEVYWKNTNDGIAFGTQTDGDETSGTNTYVTLTRVGTTDSSMRFYINTEATHTDKDGNHTCDVISPLWLTLDLAIGEKALDDVEIKVCDRDKKKIPVFMVDEVVKNTDSDTVATLSENQWVKLAIKFDNTSGTNKITSYIVNEDGTLTQCEEFKTNADVTRFYYLEVAIAADENTENIGQVLKVDNVAAYVASDYENVFEDNTEEPSEPSEEPSEPSEDSTEPSEESTESDDEPDEDEDDSMSEEIVISNNTTTSTPATGDNSNMALWIMMMVISVMGLVLALNKKRSK